MNELVGVLLALTWWIVSFVSSLTRLEVLMLLCTLFLLSGLSAVTKAIVALQDAMEWKAAEIVKELEDEESEWASHD
jgi:hypothetical protein